MKVPLVISSFAVLQVAVFTTLCWGEGGRSIAVSDGARLFVFGQERKELILEVIDEYRYLVCGEECTSDAMWGPTEEMLAEEYNASGLMKRWVDVDKLTKREAHFKYINALEEFNVFLHKLMCDLVEGRVDRERFRREVNTFIVQHDVANMYSSVEWAESGADILNLHAQDGSLVHRQILRECSTYGSWHNTLAHDNTIENIRMAVERASDVGGVVVVSRFSPILVFEGTKANRVMEQIATTLKAKRPVLGPLGGAVLSEILDKAGAGR